MLMTFFWFGGFWWIYLALEISQKYENGHKSKVCWDIERLRALIIQTLKVLELKSVLEILFLSDDLGKI